MFSKMGARVQLDEKVIALLRTGRAVFQTVAEPVDWTARMLNNKHGYPPLRIRQKVGGLNDFEGSGAEYMAYLKLLCGLRPGMDVLDIGCGCGLMCLPVNENGTLPEYIQPGTYYGFDIDKRLLRWCSRNIKAKNAVFATGEPFTGYTESYFDVVLCKSLFTHLFTHEVEDYLKEIRRLLKPGGSCLSTWFLVRETMKLRGRYTFRYRDLFCWTERDTNPRLAIAYDGAYLFNLLKKLKFSYDVWYGSWRGTGGGLSFQDIIVLRKGG